MPFSCVGVSLHRFQPWLHPRNSIFCLPYCRPSLANQQTPSCNYYNANCSRMLVPYRLPSSWTTSRRSRQMPVRSPSPYARTRSAFTSQILTAGNSSFLSALEDPDFGFVDVTRLSMLQTSRGEYGNLMPEELERNQVRLSRRVFDSLSDFRAIADTLRDRPTRFRELIPVGPPYARGACDACQCGTGGVWFLPNSAPVVWRASFPLAIQRELVTSGNSTGTLSKSDLELAGTVAHKHALVQISPATAIAERPIWIAGDNRPSLVWATKGSATASTARAYLLRLNALHHYRYVPQHDFIPGKANVMADDASRRWDLSNDNLLTHFNFVYPQAITWTLLTLEPVMFSAVIGALLRTHSLPINLRIGTPPTPLLDVSGRVSATPTDCSPTCEMSQATLCPSSSYLPKNIGPAASLAATSPCALAQWKTPSATWRRRSPGWGPSTLA